MKWKQYYFGLMAFIVELWADLHSITHLKLYGCFSLSGLESVEEQAAYNGLLLSLVYVVPSVPQGSQ